jgi:hypothetical protein
VRHVPVLVKLVTTFPMFITQAAMDLGKSGLAGLQWKAVLKLISRITLFMEFISAADTGSTAGREYS